MIIAVDFDGTIVTHEYPEIGREIPFAIKTLKMLANDGHKLILWSVREGELLEDAVNWCRERGLEFYLESNNGLFASENFKEAARPVMRQYALQKGKTATGIFTIDFETSGNVEAMDPGVMYGE